MSNSNLKKVRVEQHPTGNQFDFEIALNTEAKVSIHSYPERYILFLSLTNVDLIWIRNTIDEALKNSQ